MNLCPKKADLRQENFISDSNILIKKCRNFDCDIFHFYFPKPPHIDITTIVFWGRKMKDYIKERVLELAEYILENGTTVRGAAKKYNVSKSTVHKDITERLLEINPTLAAGVHNVLNQNKAERHIRGGLATREKYLKLASEK